MKKKPPKANGEVRIQRLISSFGVLTVLVGQILVYVSPVREQELLPPAFWIVILGTLIFLWSQIYKPSTSTKNLVSRLTISKPTPWIVVSIFLSLAAVLTMLVFQRQARTNYIPVLIFWFFSGACYLAGFLEGFPTWDQIGKWLKKNRAELLAIGLITFLAFSLRFYALGEIPRVVNGDEGRLGLTALASTTDPFANPFASWENVGALYLQGINISLQAFGVSPFSLRLPAAIGGTLAVPAVFLLGRQIWGRRVGLIAAGLLAVSHTHLHFSRTIAVTYIQGTWLIPLELYFLLSGLMKHSSWRMAVAGILLAIHFNIYLDAQIIVALILVFMFIAFLFLRSWFKPALHQAYVFWGVLLIMLLPSLTRIWQYPYEFFDRLNYEGTFQSAWLGQAVANTGNNVVQILVGRVIHAFLSLIYYPSYDFYGSRIPMLSLISATLFLVGLAFALLKTRQPGVLFLNGYFWAGTLSVGLFATPPSADTYRMLIVLPAAFLMAALGLDYVLNSFGLRRVAYITIVLLMIFSLAVFNLWAYFFNFAGQCLYALDSGPARFASYLGDYARTVDREDEIVLLSDRTYFYGSHDSVSFLSRNHAISNFPEPVETLQLDADQVIVATSNRIEELKTWASEHPGGELHYEYDCTQTLLVAYKAP